MITLFPAVKQRLIDRIEAEIRAQVAAEIEAAAPVPAEGCDPRWCHCHARYEQMVTAAAIARETGGVVS